MGKLTNKALLEQKEKRYQIITFDNNGLREMAYGNINIITLTEQSLLWTQKGYDVLVIEHNENKAIRIVTTLESKLKRKATKKEILEFINNNYELMEE